jgi:hypothetical protein
MADAIQVPPEKQLLNTPFEGSLVSASVRIQGEILSYEKSVFVLHSTFANKVTETFAYRKSQTAISQVMIEMTFPPKNEPFSKRV